MKIATKWFVKTIIHISDDKKHDKHAVSTFIDKSIECTNYGNH